MIRKLIEEAKKENIIIEVFSSRDKSLNIKVRNHQVESTITSDVTKYKVKAIYKEKTIFIQTERIDPQKIIKLIKENYEIMDNDDKDTLADSFDLESSKTKEEELDINQITEDLLAIDQYRNQYPEIFDLVFEYEYTLNERQITNSNTVLKDWNDMHSFATEISLKRDDNRKTGFLVYSAKTYDIDEFSKRVLNEITRGLEKLDEESIETSKYNIILTNKCVAKLLNAFSDMFFADFINKKMSPLANQFEKKIFSDKITIVEDPTNKDLLGTSLFDDEGSRTYYKEIVKKGVFIQKLYDKKTAIKEGKESTGNSFGVRNLFIKPGNKSYDELVQELENGIVIDDIEALHAGVNQTTGDISLQSSGYLVRECKKETRLNMIILSSSIFELFTNVLEVGSDFEKYNKNVSAPSLLLKDITIVGEKER